jgi:hypothetical protein
LDAAMTSGQVSEYHRIPHAVIERHALRYWWPWANPETGEKWPVPTVVQTRRNRK